MKRARDERRRLGPAAAAMRRGQVFRDARQAGTQITTEQLIQDATEMHKFHAPSRTRSARVLIYNEEELSMYRQRRRAEFEESVTRGYKFLGNWIKYARFEAQQNDFARMRVVLERAVAIHGDDFKLWRDYAELEGAHGFVQHARAVWTRGVSLLPAEVDLWLKFLVYEQVAGQASRVRDVFNRWLAIPATVPPFAFELYALFEAQNTSSTNSSSLALPSSSSSPLLLLPPKQQLPTTASPSQQQHDSCRAVLRRYVETVNSPDAWLFYFHVEQDVFEDLARARKVLQTAMQALPEALLWGPLECRIPLALTDVYIAAGTEEGYQEARVLFKQLLERIAASHDDTSNNTLMDSVIGAYKRFEQVHGNSATAEAVCVAELRRVYARRIARDAKDYDAHLSLYLLLREDAQQRAASAATDAVDARESSVSDTPSSFSPSAGRSVVNAIDALLPMRASHSQVKPSSPVLLLAPGASGTAGVYDEMMRCLEAAIQVESDEYNQCSNTNTSNKDHNDSSSTSTYADPHKAQQRAVLVMEYARQLEKQGRLDDARRALAQCIRSFPFDRADCPRVWLEAAELEQRHNNTDQARVLLRTASQVTKSAEMFHALIRLDGEEAGLQSMNKRLRLPCSRAVATASDSDPPVAMRRQAALTRIRDAYQAAIKTFPESEQWWFDLAKLEEKMGQHTRSHALYLACIKMLTLTAAQYVAGSLRRRYEVLGRVDAAWARCIAHQNRLLRQFQRSYNAQKVENQADETGVRTNNDAAGCVASPTTTPRPSSDKSKDGGANNSPGSSIERAESDLQATYASLLQSVWADYRMEAMLWQAEYEKTHLTSTNATPAEDAVASQLPSILSPALTRWAEAVQAVMMYVSPGDDGTLGGGAAAKSQNAETATRYAHSRRLRFLRDAFQSHIASERESIRRALRKGATLGYDETKYVHAWTELLLSPLFDEWGRFETLYGGSIDTIQSSVSQPTKRRTRLFRSRT